MEDRKDLEFVILRHGPTTSIFASKDATPPSQKTQAVKVRVADLAPISPYVIRVSQARESAAKKSAGSFLGVRMNFLKKQLNRLNPFAAAEGTLTFTEEEIRELCGEEIPTHDVFVDLKHPFSMSAVVMFSAFALLVVLPLRAFSTKEELGSTKNQIMSASQAGIAALKEAKQHIAEKDPAAAMESFTRAENAFGQAEGLSSMNDTVATLAALLPEGRVAVSGSHAIAAVHALSTGAAGLSGAFAELKQDHTLTDKVSRMEAALRALTPQLAEANSELEGVNASDLPAQFPLDSSRAMLSSMSSELPVLADALKLAGAMLGKDSPQRYLILFQNSNELRPTGGFIGSFALLDVKQGAITNLEIPGDGSYNLQGRQTKRVLAPLPLRILNPQWQFQDSNWFYDFPSSAKKAAEFYEKAGGPSVDGVIAINSGLMQKLLALTGPLEIPGTDETVDDKNFVDTAERLAQFDYDKKDNKPKAFLGALAPKLLSFIASDDADHLLALGDLISNALHSKDLQVWARADDRETALHDFSWDGAANETDGDYVALVNTNIAGGKTDGVIKETLADRTTISTDGRVIKTVELVRTHNGTKGDALTGDTNLTYHRLYVPKGSKLISVVGSVPPNDSRFGSDATLGADADLANDSSPYDMFDAWTQLSPGDTTTVTFTYEIPSMPDGSLTAFSTMYDMQSGTQRTLKHSVSFPSDWMLLWHDDSLKGDGSTLSFERTFDHSLVSSLLFKR